jgi:hypothetical protein
LFSVMQKLRDLPLFQLTRGNRSGGSLLCETAWLPSSAAAGCSSGQLGGSGKLPLMVECPTTAADVLAIASGTPALLRVQHPPPAPR